MASPSTTEPTAAKAPESPWADPPLWEPNAFEKQELCIIIIFFIYWRRKAHTQEQETFKPLKDTCGGIISDSVAILLPSQILVL